MPRPPWVGYTFAFSTCALAMVGALYASRLTGERMPMVVGFGAVIAAAAWAGPGPSALATVISLIWGVLDLWLAGYNSTYISTRAVIFSAECALLTYGSSRMWAFAREAAYSEAWHRQLMETAAEGAWIRGGDGKVAWANHQMASMLGVSMTELTERDGDELFFPADAWADRIRRENLRPGMPEQFDRRLRRADGAEIWVLTCCNRMPAGTGDVGAVLEMMTQITERRQAEAELRRSEQRFRNLFEGILEGVYESTPEGRILTANPMLLEMLGLQSQAQLNDVNIATDLYVDPAVRKRLLERLEHEGSIQNAEYELRRLDGRVITVQENARVVRSEDGAVAYYEGTLTDVTDRKRMEEQLRQAQKTEALGRLAAGVAHDFSNILTVIGGYAKLAVNELPASHPARASAEQVVEATDSAMALTRQLLSFSRQSTRPESTDLNQALLRAEPSLQLAAGSGTRLVFTLCDEPVFVHARGGDIDRIAGEIVAAASAGATSALELRTVVLSVGPEIAGKYPEIQPGLYGALCALPAPGPQLQQSPRECLESGAVRPLRRDEAGAFRLVWAPETVSRLGGFLAAGPFEEASGIAGGLHVFLPCTIGADAPAKVATTGAAGGETILLVEDEPLVRELSRDMLERQGYRVILAADAMDAERISARPVGFDLLITDAVMPRMTGPELARRLRAAHPGLKVLYIAGYADPVMRHDDMAIAGSAQIEKPFSADALGRKVRQMLDRA